MVRDADVTQPEAVDVGAMAAHLRISATRLARLLRRQADTGLSPSQLSALASVEPHGPMTLGALADHERVAPPTVTKVVGKLEELGLLVRRADASDRRVAGCASPTRAPRCWPRSASARTRGWPPAWPSSTPTGGARLAGALDVLDALTAAGPA